MIEFLRSTTPEFVLVAGRERFPKHDGEISERSTRPRRKSVTYIKEDCLDLARQAVANSGREAVMAAMKHFGGLGVTVLKSERYPAFHLNGK